MPSHKVLKSVVRSVADQFTSLMNFSGDDYVMGHLVTAARSTGEEVLSVDLLTGAASPRALLVPAVAESVAWHSVGFPDLVRRSGSDMSFVKQATLTVAFKIALTRPRFVGDELLETPYECVVTLTDDRGRVF